MRKATAQTPHSRMMCSWVARQSKYVTLVDVTRSRPLKALSAQILASRGDSYVAPCLCIAESYLSRVGSGARACWVCYPRNVPADSSEITSLSLPGLARPNSLIQHIVLVVQSNGAFDRYFWKLPGWEGNAPGFERTGDKLPVRRATYLLRANFVYTISDSTDSTTGFND